MKKVITKKNGSNGALKEKMSEKSTLAKHNTNNETDFSNSEIKNGSIYDVEIFVKFDKNPERNYSFVYESLNIENIVDDIKSLMEVYYEASEGRGKVFHDLMKQPVNCFESGQIQDDVFDKVLVYIEYIIEKTANVNDSKFDETLSKLILTYVRILHLLENDDSDGNTKYYLNLVCSDHLGEYQIGMYNYILN